MTRVEKRRRDLWYEVVVVLCFFWLPHTYYAIDSLVLGSQSWDIDAWMVSLLVASVAMSAPVLWIARRGALPFSTLGLRPFSRWDVLSALVLLAVLLVVTRITWWFVSPLGIPDWRGEAPARGSTLLLIAGTVAGAWMEELVMRAFLIPRLRYLLGSAGLAVLVSALLFGAYHVYQGAAGAIVIAVFGYVMGWAFVLCRRVLPLTLAHTAINLLVYVRVFRESIA